MFSHSNALATGFAALATLVLTSGSLAAEAPARGVHYFGLKSEAISQMQAKDRRPDGPMVDWSVPLTGDRTEGAFTLQDEIWNSTFKVPLHFHKKHAEVFFIMDGQVEWTVGGETHVMSAGDLVYIPPNTPHKVHVVGGKPMHTLFVSTPGGYEEEDQISRQFSKEALDTPVAKAFAAALGDFNPLPDDTVVPADNAGPGPHRDAHHFALGNKVRTAFNKSGNVSSRIVLGGDDSEGRFTWQDESWPADFNVPLHFHKRHYEVFYIVGGAVEWTVGGEAHVMHAGDVVYIPPNTPHKVHVVGGVAAHLLFIQGPGGYEATVDLANAYSKAERERPAAKAALDTLHDFNALKDPSPYKPK